MVMLDQQQIYDLRVALGLTAKEFGERLGVTSNTVFRWEAGIRFASRRHTKIMNAMLQELEARQSVKSA